MIGRYATRHDGVHLCAANIPHRTSDCSRRSMSAMPRGSWDRTLRVRFRSISIRTAAAYICAKRRAIESPKEACWPVSSPLSRHRRPFASRLSSTTSKRWPASRTFNRGADWFKSMGIPSTNPKTRELRISCTASAAMSISPAVTKCRWGYCRERLTVTVVMSERLQGKGGDSGALDGATYGERIDTPSFRRTRKSRLPGLDGRRAVMAVSMIDYLHNAWVCSHAVNAHRAARGQLV